LKRFLSPARLAAAGLILLVAAGVALFLVPSSSYLFLPDPAHSLGPLVKIPSERDDRDGGGIYFVDVRFRKARLIERLFPGIQHGASLVDEDQVRAPGVTERQQRKADLQEMEVSQQIAAGVALQHLGYRVPGLSDGALVDRVLRGAPAARALHAGDRIVTLDGARVRNLPDLRRVISHHRAGEVVAVRYRRGKSLRSARFRLVKDPDDPRRTIVGIIPGLEIKLPLRVRIDTRGVGGPSAGLAFALDVVEELGRDVDRGHRVAATGAIDENGSVLPVGALKQKTLGAREAHVDVFLVPAGENAREARRYADGLRVVPVKNFPQALHALATLPAKTTTNAS
jgi:PDZ domain-containing protein